MPNWVSKTYVLLVYVPLKGLLCLLPQQAFSPTSAEQLVTIEIIKHNSNSLCFSNLLPCSGNAEIKRAKWSMGLCSVTITEGRAIGFL